MVNKDIVETIFPKIKLRKGFSLSVCKSIIKNIFTEISTEIAQNNYKYRVPNRWGMVYVCKNKLGPQAKAVDWLKSRELKRKVYQTVNPFGGIHMKIRLTKRINYDSSIKYAPYIYFKPCTGVGHHQFGSKGVVKMHLKSINDPIFEYDCPYCT